MEFVRFEYVWYFPLYSFENYESMRNHIKSDVLYRHPAGKLPRKPEGRKPEGREPEGVRGNARMKEGAYLPTCRHS